MDADAKTPPAGEGQGLQLPARWIPTPTTVSEHARAMLSAPMSKRTTPPDRADKAGWRAYAAEGNALITRLTAAQVARTPCEIREQKVGEVSLYEVTPPNLSPADEDKVILFTNGGGFLHGSGIACAYMAQPLATASRLRVLSVDYRMPPDHPFPVGLEDALACYRATLERYAPEHIAIAGGSAGGGLAASLILKLRDEGLPLPAACLLSSPEADLTESGDTFETNAYIDVVLRTRLTDSIAVYADGHDLTDPYLSPVFGDFTKGFPPTIITSGTRDLFLSNCARMQRGLRNAGIECELHVWEARPHGGFFGAPEDAECLAEEAGFVRRKLCG